ncbi:V-set and immunoglobulin domain-containing protein 10-like isoform X2 [Oncorhynchus tshawytscha]|uniref:Ig-like domain-containing protein n=1 Tax=Oncorhynchus tshawytscha TaxID=74940 RepID=A0A8C8G2W2_ONCTS|nr:V-set and immunoglobulin domain-containing protein 10-like isoform X2 [Oncorhynchus tshawytscha]
MSSDQFGVHKWHIFKFILLIFMIGGVNCDLTISTLGPSLVNTTVGSNVTLVVTISGVPDPVITWKMGSLPVVTWTLGSSVAPDIAIIHRDVLKIETDGSLTFQNVSFAYSNTYTVEIVKSGFKTVSATFVLKVYDYIRNVSVNTEPADALEGAEKFTLQYSTLQGEADQWRWYFNSVEIQNNSHYTVGQKSLVIHQPNRNDTGPYTLVLTNPFSTVTFHRKITVLYGPDEPMLGASPSQAFFVSGDTLSLSCQAEGVPQPSTSWMFGGQTLPVSQGGSLNLTNVQTSQGGIYTCVLVNVNTGAQRKRNLTVNVYESPTASPLCSVSAVNGNVDLQFHCRWPGGTPEALLSFPALTNATSGAGDVNLTIPASQDLNGKMVLCRANHPLRQTRCNITASPTISDSSLFPNQNGTIVTMTWEVPPTSVITGFDIQMSGPDLLTVTKNGSRRKRAIEGFRSIQQRPGSSRSTDISVLDPKSTYYFRVIPIAGRTQGEPSAMQRIGPGGLSRPQIIGLAVGIPCGLLFLLLLIGLIYLCVYCCRKKRQQNRYPVPRAVEKVVSTQPDVNTPNHLLTGGLKPLPDYNRMTSQAAPAERSIPLPTFVAPPPVRTATIV